MALRKGSMVAIGFGIGGLLCYAIQLHLVANSLYPEKSYEVAYILSWSFGGLAFFTAIWNLFRGWRLGSEGNLSHFLNFSVNILVLLLGAVLLWPIWFSVMALGSGISKH